MSLPDKQVEDPRAQRNFQHIETYGVPIMVLDHVPTDADFDRAADGLMAVDLTGPALYIRANDTWSAV